MGLSYAGSAHPAPPLHGDAVWSSGAKPAPGFALRDQTGRVVSLSSLRGHPVLLTFLDSRCTADCPVEGRQLAAVQRRLGGTEHPEVVVVSVDPADTAASVRSFVRESHLRPPLHWLMGSQRKLAGVWRKYGITVVPRAGDITHSTVLYLIDGSGNERAGFLFPFSTGEVARDVRTVSQAHGSGWWPW